MLENPSVWLNYKNSEKKNGPEFLHSDLKDPLKVKERKKKKRKYLNWDNVTRCNRNYNLWKEG